MTMLSLFIYVQPDQSAYYKLQGSMGDGVLVDLTNQTSTISVHLQVVQNSVYRDISTVLLLKWGLRCIDMTIMIMMLAEPHD